MIIKKLYRASKTKSWDKERKTYEIVIITDYIGWFLFGFIPIYLIEIDKYYDVDFKDTGKDTIRLGINKKYQHIVTK
jgi:hypothetical protein